MPSATVLFPANPLNERQVDPEFAAEWGALQYAGVQRALVAPDINRPAERWNSLYRGLPETPGRVLYRGWMLNLQEINVLNETLATLGFELVTTPKQYLAAHHIVNWLNVFAGLTPRTTFVSTDASDAEIREAGSSLGSEQFFVKDYVKSRKHEWDTAAYARSIDALPAIVREFVRLQDDFLVGDVAIREYVALNRTVGEERLWWVNGELLLATGHPDTPRGEVEFGQQFFNAVQAAVRQLGSPFVTTDVATAADGKPVVIEVGDAQVSGLPESFDEDAYAAMIKQTLGV